MLKNLFLMIPIWTSFLQPVNVYAVSDIPNNPVKGSGASSFDWQKDWGTIHMNSFADGLNDPGALATTDGQVPCLTPQDQNFCVSTPYWALTTASKPVPAATILQNGIKFDLKHSIVNCMGYVLPTAPWKNGARTGGYDVSTCSSNYMSTPVTPLWMQFKADGYDLPITLVHSPIWDKRTNDEYDRNAPNGYPVGCQQQVANSCIMDINDCYTDKGGPNLKNKGERTSSNDSAYVGYKYPVTHVFTPQEVADLGGKGAALPTKYYRYEKYTKGKAVVDSPIPPIPPYVLYSEGTVNNSTTTQNIEAAAVAASILSNTVTFNAQTAGIIGNDIVLNFDGSSDTLSSVTNAWNNANSNNKVIFTGEAGNFKPTAGTVTLTHGLDAVPPTTTTTTSTVVYSYTPVTKRDALSLVAHPSDQMPGTSVETINNTGDSNLSRIATYNVADLDQDKTSFIVADPSDFFDLKLYVAGGKYDSGYNKISAGGLVETPDTCPIVYLPGYSGICDPTLNATNNAGCNLPIYKVGPTTTVTDANGKNFTSTAYPIAWSGYVKNWAFITPAQYLENIKKRVGPNGGALYSTYINKNPILMITRQNDYCSPFERYSAYNVTITSPDLPCIQYLQYQSVGPDAQGPMDGAPYDFMNLFQPDPDLGQKSRAIYNKMNLYTRDANGVRTPIAGTGNDSYLDVKNGTNLNLSFNDTTAVYFKDAAAAIKNTPTNAVKLEDYLGVVKPVVNSDGATVIGDLISGSNKAGQLLGGFKIQLDAETVIGAQFPNQVSEGNNISPYCAIFWANKDLTQPLFIPTNSQLDFRSFLVSAASGAVNGVSARPCIGTYETYKHRMNNAAAVNPNGTLTWIGNLKCSELVIKPTCNETKIITAQRYCLLENNNIGACSNCEKSPDPDFGKISIDPKIVGGEVAPSQSKCFFQASCFAVNAAGCPMANTSGGHVFCLAPDTKISMADGSQKAIIDIKAGEEVMAFDAKHSKHGALIKAKVKATTLTKDQEIIDIDGLKITPRHKVVLASGRGVMAQDIKIGDKILKEDGSVLVVTKIERNLAKITVYNLILEKSSDGYIANGIRVLSYPMMKGMEIRD